MDGFVFVLALSIICLVVFPAVYFYIKKYPSQTKDFVLVVDGHPYENCHEATLRQIFCETFDCLTLTANYDAAIQAMHIDYENSTYRIQVYVNGTIYESRASHLECLEWIIQYTKETFQLDVNRFQTMSR